VGIGLAGLQRRLRGNVKKRKRFGTECRIKGRQFYHTKGRLVRGGPTRTEDVNGDNQPGSIGKWEIKSERESRSLRVLTTNNQKGQVPPVREHKPR